MVFTALPSPKFQLHEMIGSPGEEVDPSVKVATLSTQAFAAVKAATGDWNTLSTCEELAVQPLALVVCKVMV